MIIESKKNKFSYLSIMFIIFVFAISLIRVFYGIEFTDESWHIAEPYAVANMGSVPFINNVTQSPAFVVPLFVPFKIFMFFNHNTEGIVLFSRMLFIIVCLVVSIITYVIIVKNSKIKVPIVFIAFQFLYSSAGTVFSLNYNTIGLIYLPLVYALLFSNDDCKKVYVVIRCIIASILAIRIIFATPQVILGLLLIFVYLIINRKYIQVKCILYTFICVFALTILYLILRYGYHRLLNWFYMYFNQGYFKIAKRYSYKTLALNFIYIFMPPIVLLVICKLFKLKSTILKFLYLCLVFLIGICLSLKWAHADQFLLNVCLWYLPYLFFLSCSNHSELNKNLIAIGISYVAIFIFSSITNVYGFGGRYYWLSINIILFSIMIYNFDFEINNYNFAKRILAIIFICVSCIVKIINNYQFVYRDDGIKLLNSGINSGIWKGLYTTTERAFAVQQLEEFIFNNTNDGDGILVLDWASFGYMMCKGDICSPTTLDILYTYNVNTDETLTSYFNIENRVPTKIIYIDFGRDNCLSIEDDFWKFNSFVNENYSIYKVFENNIFRCKIFNHNS